VRRAELFSFTAFRTAIWAVVIFLAVLLGTALLSIQLIDGSMTEEITEQLAFAEGTLQQVYENDGAGALRGAVASLLHMTPGHLRVIALYDADGVRLIGNVDFRPAVDGWSRVKLPEEAFRDRGTPETRRYLMHVLHFGDYTVVTGQSLGRVITTRNAAIQAFILSGAIVVPAMMGLGFMLSRETHRKLQRISTVLAEVARGETHARIGPLTARDQIDDISGRLDAQLEQLETLIEGTRRTAAAVAHDLRHPLARATLVLEQALLRAEAGEDPRGDIEDAQQDLNRLSAIIATVLRISQIEGGSCGSMGSVDLREVLDEVADTFGPVVEDSGRHLDYLRPAGPLMVRGDGGMLAQLTANLFENAIAHTLPGAKISLAARPAGAGVLLVLADDGPGIPEELRSRVMEPFFRADRARTVEGSGLGLALVKAIVARHGAEVVLADARPGLSVEVSFPAAAAQPSLPQVAGPPEMTKPA